MGQPDLATRLNEAITLVNSGRRAEARAILIPLSKQYPNTEQVWMWLASASESAEERTDYLEQVLRINPRNERARTAYTKLTGRQPSAAPSASGAARGGSGGGATGGRRRSQVDSYLIGALALAAVIFVVVLFSTVIGPALAPKPTITPTPIPTITLTPSITYTPSITPPSITGTFPPTWTPGGVAETPEATRTKPPTLTPMDTYTPSPTFKATLTRVPTITPGGPTLTEVPRVNTAEPTLEVPTLIQPTVEATATAG